MEREPPNSDTNPNNLREGTNVTGNVSTTGGNFIGRDQTTYDHGLYVGQVKVEIAGTTPLKWLAWLIALALAIAFIIYSVPKILPTLVTILFNSPKVTITSHHEGDDIPREINVSGTFENIPEDRYMWLYQYTYYDKYYLHEIQSLTNGTWQAKGIMVGEPSPSDRGQIFKIGVLLANSQAHALIRKKVYDLDSLPAGTELLLKPIALRRR